MRLSLVSWIVVNTLATEPPNSMMADMKESWPVDLAWKVVKIWVDWMVWEGVRGWVIQDSQVLNHAITYTHRHTRAHTLAHPTPHHSPHVLSHTDKTVMSPNTPTPQTYLKNVHYCRPTSTHNRLQWIDCEGIRKDTHTCPHLQPPEPNPALLLNTISS